MKKRKQRNQHKAMQNLLIGAQFSWQCRDPLEPRSEITHTKLSHRNPVKRVLAEKNSHLYRHGLTDKLKLKWKVLVEVEFKGPDCKQYFRAAELVIHGILAEADDHFQRAIEEIFAAANMRHYVTCHMTAEVIGTDIIRDNDFDEAA